MEGDIGTVGSLWGGWAAAAAAVGHKTRLDSHPGGLDRAAAGAGPTMMTPTRGSAGTVMTSFGVG